MKEIKRISIEKIIVNPENPRHDAVISIDESFIMQQLLSNKRDVDSMHKLICSIAIEGWYVPSVLTVTYDKEKDKYVAWDGNRRLTALKILKTPNLLSKLRGFSFTQTQKIRELSRNIAGNDFFDISCYVASSLEECAGYIKNIHTSDTSALPWNSVAIKRFENKLGKKNMFSQISEYMPEPFTDIKNDFSVSKFEKIVSSKAGKEFLGIDNIDGIFTIKSLEAANNLREKLTKIVNDISEGTIKTQTVQNSKNISAYLNNKADVTSENKPIVASKKVDNVVNETKNETKSITNSTEKNNKELSLKPIVSELQQSLIKPQRIKYIAPDTKSIFIRIDISKLNNNNTRAKGIGDLCYEIQQMCRFKENEKYTISFSFLIRTLLEQSAIYYLMNKGLWDNLVSGNSNRDLKLEKIIQEIERRKATIFDSTTLRCWNSFNETSASKDFFDLIVHHPYLVRGNPSIVNSIGEAGLFAVIQFFLNN